MPLLQGPKEIAVGMTAWLVAFAGTGLFLVPEATSLLGMKSFSAMDSTEKALYGGCNLSHDMSHRDFAV